MTRAIDTIFCFIKFTEPEFAAKFLNGEIVFNLSSAYNEDLSLERGDTYEGSEWIENSQIIDIRADHPTLGTFHFTPVPGEPSHIIQYNFFYLSFSLYAITPELFSHSDKHKIDSRMNNFGDTAVIIEEPYVFLNSIITELKKSDIEYEIRLVEYQDLTEGKVYTTPFVKKMEHKHQCEFRIIIRNVDNSPRTIQINPIAEYARVVKSKSLTESVWTANRNR